MSREQIQENYITFLVMMYDELRLRGISSDAGIQIHNPRIDRTIPNINRLLSKFISFIYSWRQNYWRTGSSRIRIIMNQLNTNLNTIYPDINVQNYTIDERIVMYKTFIESPHIVPIPNYDLAEPCAICQETMTSDVISLGYCHHTFHRTCINEWIPRENGRTCPLCRSSFYGKTRSARRIRRVRSTRSTRSTRRVRSTRRTRSVTRT